jgi:glutamyl-tRNA synthetase
MRNYLLRLGWSHGDDKIISTEQAIAWFNLESIGKSPARMDFKKLDNLNGHYIRATKDEALTAEVISVLARETPPRILDMAGRRRLHEAMPALKERAKTLIELAKAAEFLYSNGPQTLDKAAEKLLPPEARALVARLIPVFSKAEWTGPVLEQAVRDLAAAEGLKLGQVAQPLRAALTGKATSPPLFEMMALLGREESLVRLGAYSV